MNLRGRFVALVGAAAAAGCVFTAVSFALVTGSFSISSANRGATEAAVVSADVPLSPAALQKEVGRLEASRKKLVAKIARLQPQGVWVLVDSGANRIYLMDGEQVALEALCSTGKGTRLKDPNGPREWVFNTPRGEFEIRTKKLDPVWVKPDWDFIENGEPLPKMFSERVERDMLGDYAMDLGDGYLIHGTLYKRALGMSVTHGCVRVGDADLERIFKAVHIGTKVYII
jgi:L,D-transpeptidase YbiS